jgi:hypothetical protein
MLLDNLLAVQKSEKKWGEVLEENEKQRTDEEIEKDTPPEHDCKGVECEICANAHDLKS